MGNITMMIITVSFGVGGGEGAGKDSKAMMAQDTVGAWVVKLHQMLCGN